MFKKASSIQARVRDDPGSEGRTRTREATPDHNGPDYVLQPTSVYRMARDSIATQEKHASEKSRAQRLRAQAHLSAGNSPSMQSPISVHGQRIVNGVGNQFGSYHNWEASPSSAQNPAFPPDQGHLLQLEPTAPATHEFDNFFASTRFDGTWQPPETATAGFDDNSLPLWLPAMTDMYADLNFGPWPLGTDVINSQPQPPL